MVERPQFVTEKPPLWWHEAIRNNIAGNQVDPDKFVSFPIGIAEAYFYTIVSQTADDPEGYSEGIYIDTSIPENRVRELKPMMATILAPVTDVLKKEKAGHSDVINHPDQRLAELGLKLDLGLSLNVGVSTANGFIVLSLEPSNLEKASAYDANMGFDQFRDRIIGHYFDDMDFIDRARLVIKEDMPQPLRKEILKREFRDMDLAVNVILAEKNITLEKLIQINDDPIMQMQFKTLLEKIFNCQTPEEKTAIQKTLWIMDKATVAGFFSYYKRFWHEKLDSLA